MKLIFSPAHRLLPLTVALLAIACGAEKPTKVIEPRGTAGQGGQDAAVMPAPSDADGVFFQFPDTGGPADACVPVISCDPVGGRYCGTIGNGCGGTLDCGACPGDGVCGGAGIPTVCAGGPSCVPITCDRVGGKLCGVVGDGCGRALDCAGCDAGQVCGGAGIAHVCAPDPATCQPLACKQPTGTLCGKIGDGCGHTLDCGACGAGEICGVGGDHNICLAENCTPISCNVAGGGQYCGKIGDGCGRNLDCPACPMGQTCGSNICVAPPPANCQPITCMPVGGGQYCGKIGDGCGGNLDCGTVCPNAGVCGADGNPNICPGAVCTNLCKQQVVCANNGKTTVSGTVYDPAGKVPLYNILVYVPNAPLDPIATGATCDTCAVATGSPIASTLTDANGRFVLENVPVGTDIPLVMQVGKWRRAITIPSVAACVDTPLADRNQTRLPRNQTEGHIPKIALSTGRYDIIECLLRKIGIEDSEFTPETGNGRINLYVGRRAGGLDGTDRYVASMNGGAVFTNGSVLWGSLASLAKYDIVLLSCEGNDNAATKPATALQAMSDFLNLGGRVFGTHWHNFWIKRGPGLLPTVGTFNDPLDIDLPTPSTVLIDSTFPKGNAFADWLVNTGASATRGQLVIREGRNTLVAENPALAQRWIYLNNPVGVQYMTFNTPVGKPAAEQCGRMVFSDIHISSGDTPSTPFPSGCNTTNLSPQEKAIEFMFFDLASCINPDAAPPKPPAPPMPPMPPPAPPAIPPMLPPTVPPVPPPAPPPPPPVPVL